LYIQKAYDENLEMILVHHKTKIKSVPLKRISHHIPKPYCTLIHIRDPFWKACTGFLLEETEPEDALQQLTGI